MFGPFAGTSVATELRVAEVSHMLTLSIFSAFYAFSTLVASEHDKRSRWGSVRRTLKNSHQVAFMEIYNEQIRDLLAAPT